MRIDSVSLLIVGLSGITCLSIFIFCRINHVQVAEIEEYYAMQQQHRGLQHLFKICMFVLGISLAYNIRFIVGEFLTSLLSSWSTKSGAQALHSKARK
jgi:hypothetical protein